jgi:hypothetical protein
MFVHGPLVLWPEALVELLAPALLAVPPRRRRDHRDNNH